MIVLTARVHPDITAARRRTRWQHRLNALLLALVLLLLALPLLTG